MLGVMSAKNRACACFRSQPVPPTPADGAASFSASGGARRKHGGASPKPSQPVAKAPRKSSQRAMPTSPRRNSEGMRNKKSRSLSVASLRRTKRNVTRRKLKRTGA